MHTPHPHRDEWQKFLAGQLTSNRAAELDEHVRACEQCAQLIEELDRLVAQNGQPIVDVLDDSAQSPPSRDLRAGQVVGAYRLDALVGEGGMGTVFRATQLRPVERTVAIKFAHATGELGSTSARIEWERQTLAKLEHPSIPHFYTAGVTDAGTPYFVMEYIDGQSLRDYCRSSPHTIADNLRLMAAVCRTIEYAHQNGVLHRDLKPANILVTGSGAQRVAKVIDFGIAKALLGNGANLTRSLEVVGTFEYMSPEQLQLQPKSDTRSDVYALGLILYELLSGVAPFSGSELRELPFEQAIERLRREDPLPPSARLRHSSRGSGSGQTAIRARQVRGELDWVVRKAIDKDPDRRYPSALAMAEDIERYLRKEPVQAAAPSALRRGAKFVQRNRLGVVVAATLAFTLLACGSVIVSLLLRSLESGRELARRTYAAEIQKIESLCDQGDVKRAVGILRELREQTEFRELRGFELEMLWAQTHPPSLLNEIQIFEDQVVDMALASDGGSVAAVSRAEQRLVTVEYDSAGFRAATELGPLIFEDLQRHGVDPILGWTPTDKMRSLANSSWGDRQIERHPFLSCVAHSPDGSTLAVGTFSGRVIMWNRNARKIDKFIDFGDNVAYRLAFSPDGRQLAIAGSKLFLADVHSAADHAGEPLSQKTVTRVEFTPDGKQLAAAGRRHVEIWGTESRRSIIDELVVRNLDRNTIDMQMSPDGKSLLFALSNTVVYSRRWDGSALGPPHIVAVSSNRPNCLCFGKSGSRLISGSDDGRLEYWDHSAKDNLGSAPEPLCRIVGHSGRINAVTYNRRHDVVLTAGSDGHLRSYASEPPHDIMVAEIPRQIDIKHDGSGLLVGYEDGHIAEYATGDDRRQVKVDPGKGVISNVAYVGEREQVAFLAANRHGIGLCRQLGAEPMMWIETVGIPRRLHPLRTDILCVELRTGVMQRYRFDGSLLDQSHIGRAATGAAVTLSGDLVAACFDSGVVSFHQFSANGKPTPSDPSPLRFRRGLRGVKFNDDGGLLAVYGTNGLLATVDTHTWRRQSMVGHTATVLGVAFFDEGRRLMSVGWDLTVRFWETESGREILMRDTSPHQVRRLAAGGQHAALVYTNKRAEILAGGRKNDR